MMKDKSRPKHPMSAYACFIQVIREEHRRKHPNEYVDFSEFSKKCAEKWRTMTENEKKRFEDMATADRLRFNREMSQYVPPPGVQVAGQKRKLPKDPNRPKRSWSAFFFFCNEFRTSLREQHPEWRFGEVAKELGRMWEACGEKGKYENMAMEAKQRYEEAYAASEKKRLEEMAAANRMWFNQGGSTQFASSGGSAVSAPQSSGGALMSSAPLPGRKTPRDPNKPKRAWSAFFFFCDELRPGIREQHPEWRFGEVAKELGRMWEACADKAKYETMAMEAKQRYEEEMAQYRSGTFVPKNPPATQSGTQPAVQKPPAGPVATSTPAQAAFPSQQQQQQQQQPNLIPTPQQQQHQQAQQQFIVLPQQQTHPAMLQHPNFILQQPQAMHQANALMSSMQPHLQGQPHLLANSYALTTAMQQQQQQQQQGKVPVSGQLLQPPQAQPHTGGISTAAATALLLQQQQPSTLTQSQQQQQAPFVAQQMRAPT